MMKDPEIYKCIERIADVVLFRSASSVFERLILYRTTGVLLWGPPGCGKSGISEEYCRRFDRMYFINTDEIVEYRLQCLQCFVKRLQCFVKKKMFMYYYKIKNHVISTKQQVEDEQSQQNPV